MRISDWSSDVCSSDLIDARFRIQLLILHEHKIPDFNESVAIFIGGARGASWNMRAMIIEDFRTGATWTRISHRPEIIRRSDADDSFAGQARNFTPKLESLFIDRKSVVWGKCVSVRLDPVGRRHIKKKKK